VRFLSLKDVDEVQLHQELLKLPRDLAPADLGIDQRRIPGHLLFVSQSLELLQKEKEKNARLIKKQNDEKSKENYRALVKAIKEQKEVQAELADLAVNRWQPPPEVFISEQVFPYSEANDKRTVLEILARLPESFENSFFAYYFVFMITYSDDTIDTKKVQILGTECKACFELDDNDMKFINAYKVEVELYQWRLNVFDFLYGDEVISLMALKPSKPLKKSFSWDGEKYIFELRLTENQDEEFGEHIKVMKILSVPDPFKINPKKLAEKKEVKEEVKEKVQKPVENKQDKAKEKVVKKSPQIESKPVSNQKAPEKVSKEAEKKAKPKKEVLYAEPVDLPSKPEIPVAVPIPKEIGEDEIENPDVQRNLFSLMY